MRTLIALLLTSTCAFGADWSPDRATILLGSKHIGSSYQFNETNPGLLLTWNLPNDRFAVTGGAYLNSFGRLSTAAFGSWTFYRKGRFEASLLAGVAHYPVDGRRFLVSYKDFVPMGGVEARYGNFAAQYYPDFSHGMKGIVSFGIVVPLGAKGN